MPSIALLDMCAVYLGLILRGDSERRSIVHEAMMALMRRDGYEFADRIDAANIARKILVLGYLLDEFEVEFGVLACNQNSKTIWRVTPA